MKKTLLLTKEYFPFFGGVANYCYGLFKYFDKKDYLVICDHPQVKTEDNILNLALENKYIWPSWFFSFWQIKKIIQNKQIEIIFTPNILPLGSMAYFLHKFLHIPYILSLHGLDINLALASKKKFTYKILKQAQNILVNSQATAKILNCFPDLNDKVVVLYPSLTLDFTHFDENKLETLRTNLNLTKQTKIFLSVGRLSPRKGHDLVLEALYNLKIDDWYYLIVGSGPEKEYLEQLIVKFNLTNKVSILSAVENVDLIYYYKLANIFLLPQKKLAGDVEGFGMVFLEAASAALPIIAGNNGGVLEILSHKENSLLVDNLAELEIAIKTLVEDKSLGEKLSLAAQRRSQNFNSAQTQSEKLKKLLSI